MKSSIEKAKVEAYKLLLSVEDGADIFDAIYQAWVATYPRYARGPEGVALCNSIGRKLRLISEPKMKDMPRLEITHRKLRKDLAEPTVLFTPGEYDRLKQMVNDAGPNDADRSGVTWNAEFGELIERMQNLIKELPRVEVSEASIERP